MAERQAQRVLNLARDEPIKSGHLCGQGDEIQRIAPSKFSLRRCHASYIHTNKTDEISGSTRTVNFAHAVLGLMLFSSVDLTESDSRIRPGSSCLHMKALTQPGA